MARKKRPPFNDPFYIAKKNVDDLESRVMRATVPITFTPDDVIRWLLPDDVIALCKQVYPILDQPRIRSHLNAALVMHNTRYPVYVNVDCSAVKMATPNASYIAVRQNPDITRALEEMFTIEDQFNRVRYLIDSVSKWSPTAIKYYFPGLCALLPPHSPVHDAKGVPREPVGLADNLHDLREVSAIIASALMCPKIDGEHNTVLVGFGHSTGNSAAQRYHYIL